MSVYPSVKYVVEVSFKLLSTAFHRSHHLGTHGAKLRTFAQSFSQVSLYNFCVRTNFNTLNAKMNLEYFST